MINFRFHLASLVAIFLALALGVVIGAGVIDRGVVDALDNRLNRVEANSNRIQAENDQLQAQLGENVGAISALAKQALAARFELTGANVGVVAVRGVDGDRVNDTVAALTTGGAKVTGVLWLESSWKLDTPDQISALADAIGSSSRRPTALRDQAWQQLAARFAESPANAVPPADDVLVTLEDAGFVTFDGPQGGGTVVEFPGASASIVLIVGTNGDVPASDVVMPAANAITADDLPLLVGDVYDATATDAGDRGAAFVELRRSSLSTIVSTVDDVDRPWGPPTVALALADLLRVPPVVGHYGLGAETVPLPDPVVS
ncbi:MAG TPA: copper transporter [Acidimicrobiia bacterium]|nr:copper transporter [Acidimicrobiia bacterium]